MTQAIIREVFKLVHKTNPISGHSWTEHGDTTYYQVMGNGIVHSRHKSHEAADKARKELQNFYDKYDI